MKKKTIILSIVTFFVVAVIGLGSLSYAFKDEMEYGLHVSQADNTVYIEMYDYKCDAIKCDYPLEVRMVKADSVARVNNIDNVALVGINRNGTIDESTISKYFTFDINSSEWRSKIDSLSTHK